MSIVIEGQKFCGLSLTHRWHRLLIDVIDYSSMTHRLAIDYYNAQERHFSCFLVPFFSFVILLFLLHAFFLLSEVPVDDVETQKANHKYLQMFLDLNCAIFHFIIQISYNVRILISWLVDLYHMTLGCDETTSLTSFSWCYSCGVNSIHHCHYTMASGDSKFDNFFFFCSVFNLNNKNV